MKYCINWYKIFPNFDYLCPESHPPPTNSMVWVMSKVKLRFHPLDPGDCEVSSKVMNLVDSERMVRDFSILPIYPLTI